MYIILVNRQKIEPLEMAILPTLPETRIISGSSISISAPPQVEPINSTRREEDIFKTK